VVSNPDPVVTQHRTFFTSLLFGTPIWGLGVFTNELICRIGCVWLDKHPQYAVLGVLKDRVGNH